MSTGKHKYWLFKSEPYIYSIDDLKRDRQTHWEGVRNYQARNFMRDEMRKGDLILYYHSNANPPGVTGIARVAKEAYPDHLSWDNKSNYFDPKSSKENPKWVMVDVEFVEKFDQLIPLAELKSHPDLKEMMVVKPGMRLSIQPVEENHFKIIRQLGNS